MLDQCYANNRPLPQWLRNAPRLWPGLSPIYAAFVELSTCRTFGMTPGPIPWTAIMQYADLEGMDGDERANLLYLIRAMDRAFLGHSTGDKKTPPPKPKGGKIGAQ